MAKHAAGCRDRTPREPEYRARKPAVANCALKAPIEMSTSFLRPHCAHDRQPTGIAAAIYGGQGGFLWCGGHSFAGVKFRYIRLRGHQRDFIGNAMNFG